MSHWIRRVWRREGPIGRALGLLLLPPSCIYGAGVHVRNALYSRRWLRVQSLARPVISIGNLTVGGTGKTPAALWLAEQLIRRGLAVAILSRGYKRRASTPAVLFPETGDLLPAAADRGVALAGDEPFMMARMYGRTVAVGASRYEAGKEVLKSAPVDVFILDDGFQHRRLARDADVLVLGRDTDGWLLPSGPFREPRKALRRADYFLVTGAVEAWTPFLPGGRGEKWFVASLKPSLLIGFESNGWKEHSLNLLHRSKVLTVAGVANPVGLYEIIHEWEGEIVHTLEFPDHHEYSTRDWQLINRIGRTVDLIITTEKDLVKLMRFPFARDRLLAIRVMMTVENGAVLVDSLMSVIGKSGADRANR